MSTDFVGAPSLPEQVDQAVGTAPTLLVMNGERRGAGVELPIGASSIGRHSSSDILIRGTVVSRRHAELRRGDDTVTVVDLGSLNGTFVNREPIVEPTVLNHGDEVRVGDTRLLYLTGPVDA